MRRTSTLWVLLFAAGCANAGISDWFNPFRVFSGKDKHNHSHQQLHAPMQAAGASAPAGVAHSPRSHGHGGPGHRGARHLPGGGAGPVGYSHGANFHTTHAHAPPAPLLGSLPGTLDDGFKPSFPPGFAHPPSHSPNLNPFATVAGHGAEAIGKGPFLPSQLTQYHTPHVDPDKASAPLVRPVPLRNRFSFLPGRGGKGHRAHVASASGIPLTNDPTSSYTEFPGINSPLEPPQQQPEYEETPTTRPQAAPQSRPRGPFSFLSRGRRPGPPPSHHHHHNHNHHHNHAPHGGRHFGRRPSQSGPPGGGPQGPSGNDGPDAPSFIGNEGPDSNPFGSDGPPQNPFVNHEPPQNLFSSQGPLSGGPGPLGSLGNGNGLLSGSPLSSGGEGNRQGQDVFFASSPGSNTPFAPNIPNQGPEGPSPFSSTGIATSSFSSGGPPSGGGRPVQGLFGPGQSAPQGGPGGPNGPQEFFGSNGNDYPEQFQGGNRGARQPNNQQQQDDYRPQPNGPPDAPNDDGDNLGFFGNIHETNRNPQLSNFFGPNNGPQGGPGGPGGPPSFDGPNGGFGGEGSNNPFGNTVQAGGEGGPGFSPNNRPESQNRPRGRRPPLRFGLGGFRQLFQGASSSLPSHNNNAGNSGNLAMSASGSKPAVTLPVPKGGRGLLPLLRKPGSIISLSSPKDPNYRPLRLGASSLNPVAAPFEPDTAASGYHGGYGGHGLSHNGDRILYHVAGHKGPYSYQFGYDTGKGHNRIFRFEEKDGHGHVKGKYGFYDKSGKLNIINYMAHPKHGYHAERGHSHGYY